MSHLRPEERVYRENVAKDWSRVQNGDVHYHGTVQITEANVQVADIVLSEVRNGLSDIKRLVEQQSTTKPLETDTLAAGSTSSQRPLVEKANALTGEVLPSRYQDSEQEVDMASADLEEAPRLDCMAASDDLQDRAAWLLQTEEFESWLRSSESRVLILNGNADVHEVDSSTSLVSAMIIAALHKLHPTIWWFSGKRFDNSTSTMLRSLIGQLSSQSVESPSIENDANDVTTLVALLVQIVQTQLQSSSVYCVLDAVSFYEDRNEFQHVLKAMIELAAAGEEPRYPLKLLLTSPVRCDLPVDGLSVVVDAPKDVPQGHISWNLDI